MIEKIFHVVWSLIGLMIIFIGLWVMTRGMFKLDCEMKGSYRADLTLHCEISSEKRK